MARITVEDCLTKETNRFGLVLLAARRAKQLLNGAKQAIDDNRGNKSVVSALREIAAGQVRFMTEDEIAAQKEKDAQQREQERNSGGALPSGLRLGARVAPAGDDHDGSDDETESGNRNGSSAPTF